MTVWVVDRIEGDQVVLIGDGGREEVVGITDLPLRPREGMVLRVPNRDWHVARHDPAEEQRRHAEARERLNRLRKRDPGGDVTL